MALIKRSASSKLKKYLKLFPVIVVVGPRQAGKTTFAKMELPSWSYFDLENPKDYNRISSDIGFFLSENGEHCVIDEAHLLPELFPALRNYVDNNRTVKGRIVLLGSVNPLLVKGVSESLAGRVGFLDIQPFSYAEAMAPRGPKFEHFWLSGGYPEILSWEDGDRVLWMEQYVKTFVQRDIFTFLKTSLSAQQQLRLLTMIAHCHGQTWNASQTAAAFGITYHTVNRYIELMETFFLIEKLVPYYRNIGKRLVKSPKIYFRDTGLLHYLLNISSLEDLRTSPYRGFSFEGFAVEQLKRLYGGGAAANVGFYFYRTSQGDEIDLLVQENSKWHAYEIKTSTAIDSGAIKGFRRSLDQLGLEKGTVIYFGRDDYRLDKSINVKSLETILHS